ncbi:tRNA lysidine(34) synthetase TilS [Candidatus Saccharibacteria bacterium]|nr:MAG: tRNA lysidine(34) synthetase TilS [Candidatus Saccharibacteria bacterium]
MNIDMPAGRYVVAVSGGVDSVVLLHLLAQKMIKDDTSKINVVVAHFDHGIRPDSAKDRQLVQKLAKKYGLPFVYDRAELGEGASEAAAREARYGFLAKVKRAVRADAIVTAHHEDDVIETIIINWMRGTKSRGLSSLRSREDIRRPLLGMTKKQITSYARLHNLVWREDSTNTDETYLRNYIRKHVVLHLSDQERSRLLEHSTKAAKLNDAIDSLVSQYLQKHTTSLEIDRLAYRELPKEVAREVLAEWIRRHTATGVTTKLILRLDNAIRIGRNNSHVDIANNYSLHLSRTNASLRGPTT